MYWEEAQPSRTVPLAAVNCTRHQPFTVSSTFRLEPLGMRAIMGALREALARSLSALPLVEMRAFLPSASAGLSALMSFRYCADT